MEDKSEKQLIKGVLCQDSRSLKRFRQNFAGKLESFVSLKIADSRDVEEVVQDTLMDAIICLPRFSFKSSLSTWIIAIARHNIADFYRKRKIKTVVFSLLPGLEKITSRALGPETAFEELELKRLLLAALGNLSEGYRQILRLKYVEGLKVKEIAGIHQKSVKAAEMKLRRARLAFRQNWLNEKENYHTGQFDPKGDLSFLAQRFGVDLAPLFDAAKDIA